MPQIEYRSTPLADFEIKAGSDGWTFTAYASTFGNRDHGGDIIQKGAFTKTLKDPNRVGYRPLLWQHNTSEPIGLEQSLTEDSKGLIGTWEIADTQQGTDAYKLLKRGIVRSMSIGYIPDPEETKYDMENNTRLLGGIDLLENSVVSIPMNDQARVQNVKHLHCTTCLALVEHTNADNKTYNDMTLAQLAGATSDVVAAFGERTRDLLEKLTAGDFSLTEAKRTDLQALLETFSGIDAVRHDAEQVLNHKQEEPDPQNGQISSTTALALELARHRLRARGMKV